MFAQPLPILIIAFNKPHLLEDLLHSIDRDIGSKIYIHVDGSSRDSLNYNFNLECKRIVKLFARQYSNVQLNFSNTNLGGQYGVLHAIDWFFSQEEYGLILEEDIEISPSTYDFISKYTHFLSDSKYFSICLFNPIENMTQNFTLNHWVPWGWITTKTKWRLFRSSVLDNSFRLRLKFQNSPARRFPVRNFLNSVIKKVETGSVATWDAQLHAWILSNSLISVFPAKTLSRHLGNVPQASHADLVNWWGHLNLDSGYTTELVHSNIDSRNRNFEKVWRMTWPALIGDLSHRVLRILSKK